MTDQQDDTLLQILQGCPASHVPLLQGLPHGTSASYWLALTLLKGLQQALAKFQSESPKQICKHCKVLSPPADQCNGAVRYKPGTLSEAQSRLLGLPPNELTLCMTDVAGSTALWEWDANIMNAALALQEECLRALLPKHSGHEVRQLANMTGMNHSSLIMSPLVVGSRRAEHMLCSKELLQAARAYLPLWPGFAQPTSLLRKCFLC